tara:strand:+ start:7893 stop:8642 length:750 start_codon:yes stop_codon:yes gene_type:complete
MVKKNNIENTSDDFDLSILPVRQDDFGINIRRPIHPLLPKANEGANVLLVSSVKSGKTNLLTNLLLNNNFYKEAFDDVYVFSTTLHQDQTGRRIKEAFPATSYDSFDENRLQKILDYQDSFESADRPAIAIILDDLPNTLRPKSLFFTLASQYRHHGIGLLLYSVQSFKMVSPVVRNNATNLLLGTLNSSQIKQIAETYGENFSGEDNFTRYYRLAVPERFNFLYAKLDEFPNKLYKAFEDKVLYEDQM